MRPVPLLLLVFGVVLWACQAGPRPMPRESPVADKRSEHDISGWRTWQRVNPERFMSKGHGFLWVDVYVEPGREDEYASLNVAPPAGFRIVKAGYETQKGDDLRGLTVMAKMPPGYDAQNGDWWYGVLGPDAKLASAQGKLAPCIGCHRHATPRDHLFGVVAEK